MLGQLGPHGTSNLYFVCESQQEHSAVANFKVQMLQLTEISLGYKLCTQGGIWSCKLYIWFLWKLSIFSIRETHLMD